MYFYRMKRLVFSSILWILFIRIIAQNYTLWPVPLVSLTGNYGEIRPNHFHSGLDFPKGENDNQAIYAVKAGYISRIKVSPYGYGKVLYISHYDGKLTVYAHQSMFNDSLEALISREQHKKLCYEIEIFPQKNELPVQEGELIGYIGNTGGSTGPHLHFEIRDEITEIPLNPLLLYRLKDTIKPVCTAIAFFQMNDSLNPTLFKTVSVKSKKDSLFCVQDTILVSESNLGLAFCGYDTEVPNGNPNAIYEAKLFFDDILIYHHQLNHIPFDLTNFVNEYCFEYDKKKFQKCFLPAIYPIDIIKKVHHAGRIKLGDTLLHSIQFVFADEAGTCNSMQFFIKTSKIKPYTSIDYQQTNYVDCKKSFEYAAKDFTITLPPKAIYNNGFISIKDNFEKQLITVSVPTTHMRLNGTISMKIPTTAFAFPHKTVLKNGSNVSVPIIENNLANYSFKTFGNLELMTDTVAPVISTHLSVKKIKNRLKTSGNIAFKVVDKLSGIGLYHLYVNDHWVLAGYDAKNDLITANLNTTFLTGNLKIILIVQDRVGNNSSYKLLLTF